MCVLQMPSYDEWKLIETGFRTKWNFPNCIGALDGKHVNIFAPDNTSDYFNYKGDHSIVMLALVDDKYCFSYVDIGTNGRASDGGVFARSSLGQALESHSLSIPEQSVIVGNAAFPLKPYLMKPYATTPTQRENIFNYRLSKARRISENAFGILVTRFRVFLKTIQMTPSKVDNITWAAISLHNWLIKTSDMYITQRCVDFEDLQQRRVVPGTWRQQMRSVLENMPPTRNNHASRQAVAVRNAYAQLFETTEAVPWQNYMINI